MTSRVQLSTAALAIIGFAAWPGGASAQKIEMRSIQVRGTVVGVLPGLFSVKSGNNTATIKIKKEGEEGVMLSDGKTRLGGVAPVVKVTGELPVEAIVRGAGVKFQAVVDKSGNVEAAIDKLQWFDPKDGKTKLGIEADKFATPDLAGDHPATVAGTVANYRKGGPLVLSVPRGPSSPKGQVKVNLAEGVRYVIESDNYLLARPGDEIRMTATEVNTGDIVANNVEIKLLTPLGRKAAKPPSVAGGSKKDDKKGGDNPPPIVGDDGKNKKTDPPEPGANDRPKIPTVTGEKNPKPKVLTIN